MVFKGAGSLLLTPARILGRLISDRGWRGCLGAGLLLLGVWLLGEATYIHVKARLAQLLLRHAWEETLDGGKRIRPWPWADTWPIARLRVDRLGIDQIVLAGASGRSLAFGPGHIAGTAVPGAGGNSAISGHRDTHFRFLRELQDGDEIRLVLPSGSEVRYLVYQRGVYQRDDVWLLDRGEPRLTLITCYPFDALAPGGPERFVVAASPVILQPVGSRAGPNGTGVVEPPPAPH